MSVFIGYPSFMAYQMMKGKKGNNDGFPSISGITARYSALGLTNEQMAENPVWKDLTGNGHDLQMKNFAWKEGSGISDIYPGALVFDGVDDYGICENFPILTKEKGYTVVALRQFLGSRNSFLISNRATGTAFSNGAFIFERFWEESGAIFYNFGTPSDQLSLKPYSPFSYLTSKSYNGRATNAGDAVPSNTLLVGKSIINDSNPTNAAVWEICILDHDATEEELQKIQDYYKQEYPWLFFDQAWTVVGKTNEDTDRATIANITGNGNNLVLSNFGFAENSGYGLYPYNYMNWIIAAGRANFTRTANKIHVTAILKEEYATFIYTQVPSLKQRIKVSGLPEGVNLIIGRSGINFYIISQDGIYNIDVTDETDPPIIGYKINRILESCDITIEQIPEYEGYLVTDGVDDKVQSSSYTMNEDWTIVGDWELLSSVQVNCGIVKAQNVYLYNTANGLLISINNPRSLQSFGTKSLHAICSDGRLYDRNWVEYEYTVDQNFEIVKSSLNIGFNLNNYAQIAFKNLGIYDNQILSKDDCIKAYNYLQTLKAK